MPGIQDNIVTAAFRSALSDYCAARQVANGCTPHQIRHPMLLLTVGSWIRKELIESVLPEFQRHWPQSFGGDLNDGRIIVCSFDREPEGLGNDQYFFHHQLTCPLYSRSLVGDDDGQNECRSINGMLREAVQKLQVTGTLVSNLRAVALVCAEDPDSALTGELLSIARQQMSNYRNCDNVNNGIIAAFLSSTGFVSEEHLNHTKSFFQLLTQWHDRQCRTLSPVYAPYIGSNAPLIEPFSIRPVAFRTYLLGDLDSHMVSTKNERRAGILADALEMDALFHGTSVQLLGKKPKSIDDEYVILSALDPSRWNNPAAPRGILRSEGVIELLKSSLPKDLGALLRERLSLVCVGRYVENARYFDSLDLLESWYFGDAFRHVAQDWMKQTLEQAAFPGQVKTLIRDCRDLNQLRRYRQELHEWLELNQGTDTEPVLDGGSMARTIQDIWELRDEICGKYMNYQELCASKMLRKWAEECLQTVKDACTECEKRNRMRMDFEQMRSDLVQAKRHSWDLLLSSPYTGPTMQSIDVDGAQRYEALLYQAMGTKEERYFQSMLQMADDRIIQKSNPNSIEGMVFCRTNVMTEGTPVEIDEGVSKGTVLTFTDVHDLGEINIPGCSLIGIQP